MRSGRRGGRRAFKLYGPPKSPVRWLRRIVWILFLLVIVHTVISSVLLTTVRIGSTSMEPTLSQGDRLLVTPLVFGAGVPFTKAKLPAFSLPSRGDLVVARPPYDEAPVWTRIAEPIVSFFTFRLASVDPARSSKLRNSLLVKRVVGLPGDTVRATDYVMQIKPSGAAEFSTEFELVDQSYNITFSQLPEGWTAALPFSGDLPETVLGEDEYYLRGDNRSGSSDSAVWGPLPESRITAKVLLRYWPLRRFGRP